MTPDLTVEQRREIERRMEIAELFGEAQGPTLEELCFEAWDQDRDKRREGRKLGHAARSRDLKSLRARRARKKPARSLSPKYRRFLKRYKADAEFRARSQKLAGERYQRWLAAHPRPRQAKLSRELVADARRLYAKGLLQVEVARLFGVSASTISLAVKGKIWRTAKGPIVARAPVRPRPRKSDSVTRPARKRPSKRERYAADPERFKAYERNRRKRNGGEIRKRDRERYAANVVKVERQRKARLAQKTESELARLAEQRRAIARRYFENHRAKILEKQSLKKDAKREYDKARHGTRRKGHAHAQQ